MCACGKPGQPQNQNRGHVWEPPNPCGRWGALVRFRGSGSAGAPRAAGGAGRAGSGAAGQSGAPRLQAQRRGRRRRTGEELDGGERSIRSAKTDLAVWVTPPGIGHRGVLETWSKANFSKRLNSQRPRQPPHSRGPGRSVSSRAQNRGTPVFFVCFPCKMPRRVAWLSDVNGISGSGAGSVGRVLLRPVPGWLNGTPKGYVLDQP